VETIVWENTCADMGVTFGARFQFDPDWSWFEAPTTDYIPRPFVDYFCDNIGEGDRCPLALLACLPACPPARLPASPCP